MGFIVRPEPKIQGGWVKPKMGRGEKGGSGWLVATGRGRKERTKASITRKVWCSTVQCASGSD